MFDSNYFRKRKYIAWRAPIVCSSIKNIFQPVSVIDFGCSIGEFVSGFNDISVPAIGFDFSEQLFNWSEPDAPIVIWDITAPLPTKSKFDLALCIEVLRFIPDEKIDALIENFRKHSERVLIGYSGGRQTFVIEKMYEHGYCIEPNETDQLRKKLETYKTKPAIKAIYHGGMYFTHD